MNCFCASVMPSLRMENTMSEEFSDHKEPTQQGKSNSHAGPPPLAPGKWLLPPLS